MTFSLNEVEATAKKAARGVGYPWGLAEEAAKATRWLCARDIDGCAALADLLGRLDGQDLSAAYPNPDAIGWSAPAGMLCPIATGAALTDHADQLAQSPLQLSSVAAPVLLLPFIAYLAECDDGVSCLICEGKETCTDGDAVSGDVPAFHASSDVQIARAGQLGTPRSRQSRADPDAKAWEILLAFAHRTYAPATEESRLKGAGAGLSDND